MAVKITPGNEVDGKPFEAMASRLEGKVPGDNGYSWKPLFRSPWQHGLQLATGIRRNMKCDPPPIRGKKSLRKRFTIKTLFGKLETGMGREHTRDRSPTDAFDHILSNLAAISRRNQRSNRAKPSFPASFAIFVTQHEPIRNSGK